MKVAVKYKHNYCTKKLIITIINFFHFCFRDNKRPVLIPLPFIRSQINVVSSVKQQKPTYSVPYIYSNGPSNKGKLQDPHKQNTTSAAVIMFDPMNIPDLGHGGALKSNFAVEWKSANKSNKQDNLNADFKISQIKEK